MIVREVIPFRDGAGIDLATPEGRCALEAVYSPPRTPWVRLNMVTTLTGAASGGDGTSDSITNRVDRAILATIRAHADAVVVGAQTVRAEGYVLPRSGATLAIVTSSGDIGSDLADQAVAQDVLDRILLLVPHDAVEAVAARTPALRSRIVGLHAGAGSRIAPAAIVATLAQRGMHRLVCEGGTTLASQFLAATVVDELCVTVAPRVTPAASPFVRVDDAVDTDVTGMLVDEAGFSYLRVRVRR